MMFWRRLGYLLPWRRRAAERDMQEELRSIAAMARPAELGNLTLAAEDARAQWEWPRLAHLSQDLRYAGRMLARNPAFTAAAVLSLAIGIGANTALFTLINTVTWKLLPVRDPESLLVLGQQGPAGPVSHGFTFPQYERIRDHAPSLSFAAYSRLPLNVSIDGVVEPTAEGQLVTGEYFPLLGVQPVAGRLIGPDDDRVVLGHPVAVLSHAYWRRRFGADPAVVGRQIVLSGTAFTVVGVAPAEFFGTEVGTAPEIYAPVSMQPAVMLNTANLLVQPRVASQWLRLLARLKPDASTSRAGAQLDALAHAPETDWRPRDKFTGQVMDLRLVLGSAATGLSDLRRQFSQPLLLLLAITGLVLLAACANVGNLLLARSAARQSEFAMRIALGAGRPRLVRQVLTETLLLAGLAGVSGAVLAYWMTRALVAYAAAGHGAIALDLSPDLRVLAFTAAVSLLAGLMFGTLPALRATRAALTPDGRRPLGGVRQAGLGRGPGKTLVIVQVAVSLVLLAGAGLFVRTLQKLGPERDVHQARVLIARVEPRGSANRGAPGVAERFDLMYRDLLARVSALPGVQAASLARSAPLSQTGLGFGVARQTGDPQMVSGSIVYPRYFQTMGIPIVRGRDFTEDDLQPGSPTVFIVNEAFVREFAKDQDPLADRHGLVEVYGRRRDLARDRPMTIVGVVADTRYPSLREAPRPLVYQTFLQANTGFAGLTLHVRASNRDPALRGSLARIVQAIDPDVPIADVHTLADEVDAALVRERLVATLSGAFGVVALALICIGLYGLMAFTVSSRAAEIGVRVALGASRGSVRWLIARQALAIAAGGVALGVPAAWLTSRLASRQLEELLFEVTPADPIAFGAAVGLLVLVIVLAALLPAHRAALIDPTVALRHE